MPFITVTYPPKYPLTESEKEWLEDRQENLEIFGGYFCPDCPEFVLEDEGFMYCGRGGWEQCVVANPHKFIFKDCAEFEARVAARTISIEFGDLPCGAGDCADPKMLSYTTLGENTVGCDMCVLRAARLAVEAEMELP